MTPVHVALSPHIRTERDMDEGWGRLRQLAGLGYSGGVSSGGGLS